MSDCPNCGAKNPSSERSVSVILFIGIAILPILFAWVTLQKGYSLQAKIIAFGYLAVSMIVGSILFVGSGGALIQAKPEVQAQSLQDIHDQVARDAANQYNIALSQGDKVQICVQAGLVAAAYLQAERPMQYREWKLLEEERCKGIY
ncbi:MAG: hypothetical protein VXW65_11880 [Pseudomonadota bacterium]|nr:hypothetical protein [Pseudomonadota bacterium]